MIVSSKFLLCKKLSIWQRQSTETGRTIGIYPETKHPTYHDSVGLSLEEPLVDILKANGYDKENSCLYPVV